MYFDVHVFFKDIICLGGFPGQDGQNPVCYELEQTQASHEAVHLLKSYLLCGY